MARGKLLFYLWSSIVPVNRCISDIIWYFPYALQAAVTADVTIPTCFPNLVELGIVGCSRVMHLEALPTFSNLRSLDFEQSSCWKADMTVLTSCTNLLELNLGQSGLMDLSPLSACINLVNVKLRVSQREDISPISACTKLTVDINEPMFSEPGLLSKNR